MITPVFKLKMILSGIGGQGVVFMTRLLAQTAIDLGHEVIASETHGMSQRGGSVLSHLKIDGTEAPLIRKGTADLLLALDLGEAIRSVPFLRRGSRVFINSEDGLAETVQNKLDELEIGVHILPASQMAIEYGSPAVANVILIGFAAAFPELPFSLDEIASSLERAAPRGLAINQKALSAGYKAGVELARNTEAVLMRE